MATALSNITCGCQLGATLSDTYEGVTKSSVKEMSFGLALTSGTTANKADRWIFDIDRVVTSGNNEDLDLYDLAGFDNTVDLLGNTTTFAEIVAIIVENESGSAGTLVLGGNGTAAAWNSPFNADDDGALTIAAGGFVLIANPKDAAYAVTDTSNHLLRVAASGGNITYNIGVLGRSA